MLPKDYGLKHWKPKAFEERRIYAELRMVHKRDLFPLRDKAREYDPISRDTELGHLRVDPATLIQPAVAANKNSAITLREVGVCGQKFDDQSAILTRLQCAYDDYVRLDLAEITDPLGSANILPFQIYP
jgi:hypothetical protein